MRVMGLGRTTISRGALHEHDEDLGWVLRPGLDSRFVLPGSFDVAVRSDAFGARAPSAPPGRPAPGAARAIVLGDSFAWGFGVEDDEAFAARLPGLVPGLETVNLAVNGYSTVQELIRYEREGARYHAGLVVLAFTWNDLEDNFDDKRGGRPVAHEGEGGAVTIANRPVRRRWKAPAKQWLRHNSRLFGLAEYQASLWKVAWRDRQSAQAEAAPGGPPPPPPSDGDDVVITPREVYAPPTAEKARAWRVYEALLRQLKARVEADGARLLVLYDTHRDEASVEIFRASFGVAPGEEGLDWDRPARGLKEVCARVGVPVCDPTPAFRGDEDPARLFLVQNGHWSAEGHALVARELAKALRDAGGAE